MPVFALLIISRAGSLIYHKTFPTTSPSSPNAPVTGTLGLPGTTTLTTNDYLVLAGTFHGVHAITKGLTPKLPLTPAQQTATSSSGSLYTDDHPTGGSPTKQKTSQRQSAQSYSAPNPDLPVTGIESLESSFFKLSVFQSLTGTKFLLFTDPSMPNTDNMLKGIYERFADYVCKNPFWVMDNPVRIDAWDRALNNFLFRR